MHPMLNIAVRAARRAGTVIMRGQQRLYEVQITRKGHQDYVTQIDKDSESVIIDTLLTAYPGHQIIAEESGTTGRDGDYVWIVDPLDGTLNFMHGYQQFAVSIALQVRGRVEQAVVFDPVRDELFTASRGAGAQLNGHRLRVSKVLHLEDALIGTGFPVRRKARIRPYMASLTTVLERCADVRRAGAAALDLAHVASGRLDGFWEFGLQQWDIAAGALLVLEAGGLVGDPDGGETHMDKGDVVAGNAKVFRQLLGALATREGGRAAHSEHA